MTVAAIVALVVGWAVLMFGLSVTVGKGIHCGMTRTWDDRGEQ